MNNVPDGGIIAFNHPKNDILLPAVFKLITNIKEYKSKNVVLVTGSEVILSAKLNDKTAVPGSVRFMKRLHSLYPDNIISTPTVEKREDFVTGRAIAARKIIRNLKCGNLIAIAPEGHTEENEVISPIDSYHHGTGVLAKLASMMGKPVVPAGIMRVNQKDVSLCIGEPFFITEANNDDAAITIMREVARMLPRQLRGPFDSD
jgi:hypothetical protein